MAVATVRRNEVDGAGCVGFLPEVADLTLTQPRSFGRMGPPKDRGLRCDPGPTCGVGLACLLNGRPLSPEELEMIRREIEAFDDIGAVSDEIRGIVARNWPHLLSKLPPPKDE